MIQSPFNPPVYPIVDQLLRVTAGTVVGPNDAAQVAGSSILAPQLHVAFTQQMRDDGSLLPRDREPCLAAAVRGYPLTPGFHLGRLAGSWTGLPVYEVVEVGLTGSVGPMGPAGATGPAGSTGNPGSQGTIGATGSTGNPGSQGSPGATGSTGNPGTQGSQGQAGPTGPSGSTGNPGTQGSPGATGSTGNPGTQGSTGPIGPAGSCGPCGSESPSLISGLLRELPGYIGDAIQILIHTDTGIVQWFGGIKRLTSNTTFTATVTGVHTFRAYGAGQGGTDTIGSGGAGGHYAETSIYLTVNDAVTITVATGGVHQSIPAVPGDTSAVIGSTTIVLARGGGSLSSDTGTITRAGGTGGSASIDSGGGGGGCGGPTAAGGNGGNASAGAGGAGGTAGGGSSGAGGAGGGPGAPGIAGNSVGGGGGGGGSGNDGRNGYDAQMIITW